MTPTSSSSSIIAALGAGSGVDFAALATNLAAAQFATRIDRLTAQSETLDQQISAASNLKSAMLQLSSSIGDRVRNGDLSTQPTIANAAVATVSRGTASASTSYTLEVIDLAAAQTLDSPPILNPADPIGAGSLTLRFGTINGSALDEDPAHPPVTITIASGATIADVAGAINAAGSGVSAYVSHAADGDHLVLKGAEGLNNAFTLEATETPGEEGLAQLAWTPAAAPERLLVPSADARFKLDGVLMASSTNTVTDVAPGLSLKLTGTNEFAPTTIRFSDPASAVTAFMQDLVGALNELSGALNENVDPQSGDLARDSGARSLRRTLSQLAGSLVMPGAPAGGPARLADLGLATERDGTFRLDTARLAATLKASPQGVAAMFTTGLHGVYATFDKMTRSLSLSSDPGSLAGSIARYTARKTKTTEDQARLAEAQERLRQRLATQFAATDSRVTASKSTLSFLQNQIDAWNAQRN